MKNEEKHEHFPSKVEVACGYEEASAVDTRRGLAYNEKLTGFWAGDNDAKRSSYRTLTPDWVNGYILAWREI